MQNDKVGIVQRVDNFVVSCRPHSFEAFQAGPSFSGGVTQKLLNSEDVLLVSYLPYRNFRTRSRYVAILDGFLPSCSRMELYMAVVSGYVIWWRAATREIGSPEEMERKISR